MTADQAAAFELQALGLTPGKATSGQITAALKKNYPQGLPSSLMDPHTGLPYTPTTSKAAGSGNIVGRIIGLAVPASLGEEGVAGISGAVEEGIGGFIRLINPTSSIPDDIAQQIEDATNPSASGGSTKGPTAQDIEDAETGAKDDKTGAKDDKQGEDLKPKAQVARTAGVLLGAADWEQFALRVLEGLVGVALIFLGLQALTGVGDGTPQGAAQAAGKFAGPAAAAAKFAV